MVVDFIDAHRSRFGIEPICRVLCAHDRGIAPSTYFAFKARPLSARAKRDAVVVEHIRRVHASPKIGRGLYGVRKVWHELRREQVRGEHPEAGHIPKCQVERLMRSEGLQGVRRGKQFVTTRPDANATRAPDLVDRKFEASRPNQLWVVDFTYVPTWSGMVFTAFVIDVFSRRIVGWRTKSTMPKELPLDALEMALWTRAQADEMVKGVIHHSDAGAQYCAITYTDRLKDAGALASIGTVGDSYDNAMAESLIGLYKTECVKPEGPWSSADDLELATLNWVWWFNHTRIHSSIGHITPIEHETIYHHQNNPQDQPIPGTPALH